MTIGLPIEIKVREFLSKVFFGVKLAEELNQDVLIGEKNQVYRLFKNTKNFYLISKGGPVGLFKFEKEKFSNNYLGLLDEEAPLINIGTQELLPRIHKKILENVDEYFVWGKKDFGIIKKKIKDKNKFLIFGHPKFDLLKSKNISFFEDNVSRIKKKYKNLIFIPSSFITDQVMGDKKTDNFQIEQFLKKTNDKIKFEYKKKRLIEEENYNSFIKLLIELSKKNPNYNFVFRPHPRQSLKKIKNRFLGSPKNLHIVFEGTITPWIIASDLYIHYGCTSSLEAAILKKKIIFFVKDERALESRNIGLFKSIGYNFNNYERCVKFINLHLSKKLKKMKNSRVSSSLIYNSSKYSFSDNFINFFKKKYSNKIQNIAVKDIKSIFSKKDESYSKRFLSNLKNIILKNEFLSSLAQKKNSNFLLSKDYKLKKFDGISFKEIKKTVLILQKKIKLTHKIKVIEIDKNLFLLKRDISNNKLKN